MMQYKLRQFQGCHNGNCTNSKHSKPFHVVFHKKSFVIESTLRIFTDITTFRTKEDVLFSRSSISSSNAKFQRSNIFLKRVVLKFSLVSFPRKREQFDTTNTTFSAITYYYYVQGYI